MSNNGTVLQNFRYLKNLKCIIVLFNRLYIKYKRRLYESKYRKLDITKCLDYVRYKKIYKLIYRV